MLLVLVATEGVPAGALALVPLAALVVWSAVSISWSALPDRSWNYANRTFVYLLFAALGLYLARSTRPLALGLAALLGALLAWSLLGKVLPVVADYGPPGVGRLRGPIGLWNQLALAADFALPLALWRRRLEGRLLAYSALVALSLTYSRGGLLTAAVVVGLWLAFDDERQESASVLVAAALPAAVVVGVAFALPGVTGDGQPAHVRWRDGLIFGALLAVGGVVVWALRRLRLPRLSGRVVAVGATLLVVAAVVAFAIGGSSSVGNGGGRLSSTSSNFRFTWWGQALDGWRHHVVGGTGAGSFNVTNLRFRRSYLDFTTEPHDLPLQFLTETGVVGLLLLLLSVAALLRGMRGRRGHELALALVFVAFLVHSLVDVDWDFVAVAAPAFLSAGALAGRPEPATRVSPFAVLVAAGAALLAFGSLLLPWLGSRWSDEALGALGRPSHAITLAKRARAVDPLLVEPLWWQAYAQSRYAAALALYAKATRVQPQNAQAWLLKAQFELAAGCARAALTDFYRFNALNPFERPDKGPNDYRRALRLVDSGKPRC